MFSWRNKKNISTFQLKKAPYLELWYCFSIGFAIAQRLAEDGAKVMLSSRKQSNVDKAVKALKDKGLAVSGTVCHVAKKEQRQKMIQKVRSVNII